MDNNSRPTWERARSLKTYIREKGCREYEELVALRAERFTDELLKRNFGSDASRRQQQRAAEYDAEDDKYWMDIGHSALKQIDEKRGCIPGADVAVRFLDLGCCPGGFSDYILCKNPQARGVGISLDTKYGGHGLAIPGPQCKRFEMHWIDLTYLAICSPRTQPAPTGAVALSPTPFDIRPRFQLIILDGVYREPSAQESSSTTHPWDMDRLLIAQFIIALEYINRGGTLLVKLSHLESVTTAQLVYMLDRFSKAIVIFKPYVNATRGSFYAVVTGVGLGWEWKRRASFLQNLREVWWNLTYGDGPRSEGRYLKEKDLNFIVEFETLKGWYLERLIQLGRVSWRVQSQALRRTYDRIRSREVAHVSEPECDAPEI